jgi:hypothetical protein
MELGAYEQLGYQKEPDFKREPGHEGRHTGKVVRGVMHGQAPSSLPAADVDARNQSWKVDASVGALGRLVNRNLAYQARLG